MTGTALDVLRAYLPAADHVPPCGVGRCRIPDALADLDELVEAARALSEHGDAEHYTGWFRDHHLKKVALKVALARVLGETP